VIFSEYSDITEILLKVALNTIHLNKTSKIGEEGIPSQLLGGLILLCLK
jgi:hypothetical protein